MTNDLTRVFFIGDVVGPAGLRCIASLLPGFLKEERVHFCIINGENATGGTGISASDTQKLFAAGADVITGGNHSFEKREFWNVFTDFPRVLRPANFPEYTLSAGQDEAAVFAPGQGAGIFEKDGIRYAVLNVQGRENMTPLDCPFRCADRQINSWLEDTEPP
ncbi:YmdB family metallophosphoesterase [Brucepastera parasyntrophica]|uniref:YmdB family metallophosphoesterase n=1 Tax=Brucepastera parasyntrophica TaxID=2880008 RepID=UPI002109D165|nr:YmdB family metallophosphoesterase [Brucepastera parasyntrophica]